VITQDLADRIEYLTRRAVKAFDRMVEMQLVFGLTHYRYYNARNAYERELSILGMAMTKAVGVPGDPYKESLLARGSKRKLTRPVQ
jgi:hypothetical protein